MGYSYRKIIECTTFFILDALPAAILLVFTNVPNLVSIMFDMVNLHKIKYLEFYDIKI